MTIFFVHFGGHISKIYNLSCIEVTKHHLEQNVEFHSICYQTQIIYKGHKKIENECSIMKIHEQAVVLVFVLAVVGDLGSLINKAWSGTGLVSQNSAVLMPGADAFAGVIGKTFQNLVKGKEQIGAPDGRRKRSRGRGRSGSGGRGSKGRGRSGSRRRGRSGSRRRGKG